MSDKRPRLEVYLDESILFQPGRAGESFPEGDPSPGARIRLQQIKERLDGGHLAGLIRSARDPGGVLLDEANAALLLVARRFGHQ